MPRFTRFAIGVLTCTLFVVPLSADDPPKKLTPDDRKQLEAKWKERNASGFKSYQAGKIDEAVKVFADALQIARQLYPKSAFPDGHANLATSLNNLAGVYLAQGKLADAEPLFKDALDMSRRLFKGDHRDLAQSLNNLAFLYHAQGKLAEAETLYMDALAMNKRLFKGNHTDLATSLNNLAGVYEAQGKLADAETFLKDVLAMYKRLFKGDHPDFAASLGNLARLYQAQGKLADAEPLYKDALAMHKRLFKGDHPDLATSLHNLAILYEVQEKLAEAETLYKDALAMRQRLVKGDHPDLATSLNDLALLYVSQGKLADAETLFKDALDMSRRLFKGDHRQLATNLSHLASLYVSQGKLVDAETLFKDALAMRQRLFKGDYPDLANSLHNLAGLYHVQGKLAEAETLYKDALAVRQRLFKGDHTDLAQSLNNLALLYKDQGKLVDAETLFKDALAMRQRLFKGDHTDLAQSLSNLAVVYQLQGKQTDAESLSQDAFEMSRRMTIAFAKQKAEGESLTLIASLPLYRDAFLSCARSRANEPGTAHNAATAYPAVWAAKGTVARVYEQRQLQARAAATDPALAKMLAELADARRRRAEVLLAPATKDPGTLQKRKDDLKALEEVIAKLNHTLSKQLPAAARVNKLNDATSTDMQKALPPDAAVMDYAHFTFIEFDNARSVGQKMRWTARYLAFVVTQDRVVWVDLDTAANIDTAVTEWRTAIIAGKEIPAAIPAKVRELVWEKVRKELPANIKTVYVSPDAALCRVPWAGLPGDKPNTILLEDFAVATIPHAPFLLDKLWPQDTIKNPPTSALVVGGVKYDAELTPPAPNAVASRGEPLLRPGEKRGWGFLPATAAEATGVADSAATKKLPVMALMDDQATTAAVLATLPKAKYAHFATHGFFADPSFRSIFQLDEGDYQQSLRGERIGRAAKSPLVMTGLVFAGANNPKTPGRGFITGESIIDLDLSGLELAVLSACETGLGDVAGGEGTFGLQRAFHMAGTRDVVASLWKVPDEPTTALMALFYGNLWTKNLSPMESLRQAQLEIYRNPDKVPELAKGFRGPLKAVPGTPGAREFKPGADGKAHPVVWAAFTLSGPGR